MPQGASHGTLTAPRTKAEFDALHARRNEMNEQLSSLEDRRTQLAAARARSVSGPELDKRLKAVDQRIDQLEKQITTADELINAAHWRPELVLPDQPRVAVEVSPSGPGPGLLGMPSQAPVDISWQVSRALAVEGIGFLLLGAVAWIYAVRRLERRFRERMGDATSVLRLQQSVDAIAVEVERISENQRFVTKALNDKSLGEAEARPIDSERAAEPIVRRGS